MGTAAFEKLTLKWDDFQSNVSSSFRRLRDTDDFYDVTLVSDDQQQMSAHKIVLAAISGYFKKVLKENRHSNPLLCLNGVNSHELRGVLDYIYNGEVQINQEHLDNFLKIAQRFQLDGLLEVENKEGRTFVNDSGQAVIPDKMSHVLSMKFHTGVPDDSTKFKTEFNNDDESMTNTLQKFENNDVKSMNEEQDELNESSANVGQIIYTLESERFSNNIELLERALKETIVTTHTPYYGRLSYSCTVCSKKFSDKFKAIHHAESEHMQVSFRCQYCAKTYASRTSLRTHILNCCPYAPLMTTSSAHKSNISNKSLKPNRTEHRIEDHDFSANLVASEYKPNEDVFARVCMKCAFKTNHIRSYNIHTVECKVMACVQCCIKFKEKSSMDDHFMLNHSLKKEKESPGKIRRRR